MIDELNMVREFALEIEDVEAEITALNQKKSGIYKTAKAEELDVGALRTAIALRRKQTKDPKAFAKRDRLVDEYLKLIDQAPRVRAHEEADQEMKGKTVKRAKSQAGDQPGAAVS